MGRVFLEHIGGLRIYSCLCCKAPITNRRELISTHFTSSSGAAYLFKNVVNVLLGEVRDRNLLSGRHKVCNLKCKKCKTKIGWYYEFAYERTQKYKETRYILEVAFIIESTGFPEVFNDRV